MGVIGAGVEDGREKGHTMSRDDLLEVVGACIEGGREKEPTNES